MVNVNGYSFKGSNYQYAYIPSKKGSTLKGRNLHPVGANSFLLGETLFQKGFDVQELKQEVTKIVSLVANVGKCNNFIQFLKASE